MKKKNILAMFIFTAFAVLFISGCAKQQGIVCNAPYIKVGNDCCLDQNFNGVCDAKESTEQEKTQVEGETGVKSFCGNGICELNETGDNCPKDCTRLCGNGVCGFGESCETCPVDCPCAVSISPVIKLKVDYDRADYVIGNIYQFHEEIAKSDTASIYMDLENSGNNDIKNMTVSYSCTDTATNITYKIGSQILKHEFYQYEETPYSDAVIANDGLSVLSLPAKRKVSFQLDINIASLDNKNYHPFSCHITFSSTESGLKKELEINNYWLKNE